MYFVFILTLCTFWTYVSSESLIDSFLHPTSSIITSVLGQSQNLVNTVVEPGQGLFDSIVKPKEFLQILGKADPDDNKNIPELIASRGFGYEIHPIVTDDGYILTTFRIINPKIGIKFKRPVLLMHGLLASATQWIMNPGGHIDEKLPNGTCGTNLGYELGKDGYDVWLGNVRGNKYALRHVNKTINARQFWNFSKDEMIKYDLPNTIDYILRKTNQPKLSYIAHSQGTHIMFGLLSTQRQYNDIVEPFIALAPVGTVRYVSHGLRLLANQAILHDILMTGFNQLLNIPIIESLSSDFCKGSRARICASLLFVTNGGGNTDQLNVTRIPTYLNLYGWGTSTKNIVHWGKNIKSGEFEYFDYGDNENYERYGTKKPPRYDLTKITSKNIALFSSVEDNLADPQDVDILRSRLQNRPVIDYVVPLIEFSHLDFTIGTGSGKYVNSKIKQVLSWYYN